MNRRPGTRKRTAKGIAGHAPWEARSLLRRLGKEGLMRNERLLRDCDLSTALWAIIAEHCEIGELFEGQDNAFLWMGDEGVAPKLEALLRREDDFCRRFINTRGRFGQTLLHRAVEKKWTGVVAKLLSSPDVDTEVRDRNGKTPLQLASDVSTQLWRMLAAEGAWMPASKRESPCFQMAAVRQAISLRGAVFPYGFNEVIRGIDIRDADLSRTRLSAYKLRNVRDLSGVRLPERCAREMKEARPSAWSFDNGPARYAPGSRLIRSTGRRISYRRVTRLAGGAVLENADLTDSGLVWEDLEGYAVFQGVVFPDGFDMTKMHNLGWKRFLYCDFSRCRHFPYDFHLRAGQVLGPKFPPLDFREVHFEGFDLTDADFSAQIPADWADNLE